MQYFLVVGFVGICAFPWHSDCPNVYVKESYNSQKSCESARVSWSVIDPDPRISYFCMAVKTPHNGEVEK